jgi:hypothetical protein
VRLTKIDPSTLAMIRIESIHAKSFHCVQLGFAYINLFWDQDTNSPATSATIRPVLMNGCYQIPIVLNEVQSPFTIDSVDALE